MTEHVSTYMAPIFNTCPVCKASPFAPCVNLNKPRTALRYVHQERTRARS